jgi:hypothetical protein
MQVIACVRPNNVPLPKDFDGPTIESFDQVELLASPTRNH